MATDRPAAGFGEPCVAPLAGTNPAANRIVAGLHDAFGFDVLDTEPPAQSWQFERAKPACCISLDMDGLHRALDAATRDGELTHGSWRH